MFKNKAIQMTLVNKKDDEVPFNTETFKKNIESVDPAKIAEIATDSTIKIVTVVGAAIAANKVLTTVCEIAKIAAQAKLK